MDFDKGKYWLWLSQIPGMWHEKAVKALNVFGTPESIFDAAEKRLEKSGIFKENDIYNIVSSKQKFNMEKEWETMIKKGIRFTYEGDESFPQKLLSYSDRPRWLYYKGKLPDLTEKTAGIVGARNCSRYGKIMAENIAAQLGRYSVSVISGMARGIDSAAHRGAAGNGGKTYAVLGCGVDVCYPRENIELYMKIQEQGGIISEYPPGTQPLAWQFPERNRIISMLSDVVAIIEAKKKSGSLITTDYALAYGKEVFAVPGRTCDCLSEGCNELIKSGASLLTEAEDMLFAMGLIFDNEQLTNQNKKNIVLEKENEVVYSCLCLEPQSIEELVRKTGMTSSKTLEVLMELMIKGLVIEPAKNHYVRK